MSQTRLVQFQRIEADLASGFAVPDMHPSVGFSASLRDPLPNLELVQQLFRGQGQRADSSTRKICAKLIKLLFKCIQIGLLRLDQLNAETLIGQRKTQG